jgi:hypothetical protein
MVSKKKFPGKPSGLHRRGHTAPVKDFAHLDLSRAERTYIPEIIFCENKSADQILLLAKKMHQKRRFVMGTRCDTGHFGKLKRAFRSGVFSRDARAFRIGAPLAFTKDLRVGVVSAGTTDIAACEEAAFVLESLGVGVERIYDVGVAGMHRLFAKEDHIESCDVLIVAAGMEGALPSVVAGLYPHPVIALPTSVGYGTALGGFTAMFAMLTSCSPGVTVVNINNGVGAATAAYKILKLVSKCSRNG